MTRILLVEDEPAHAEAIRRSLADARPSWRVDVADCLAAYRRVVSTCSPDLVLLDYLLPDGQTDSLLVYPPEAGQFPMILMTSHGDEHLAVEAMKRGALDYVVKSSECFAAMPRIIENALRAWRLLTDRARAEQRVRQLSRAVEQSPVSIVIADPDGKIGYANPRFTQATGYTLDEIRGQNLRSLQSEPMGPGHSEQLWERLMRGSEWRGECHSRRRDGELFWEQVSISPILDAAGRITNFVAVKEDITERKRAEQALQKTSETLQTIIRAAPMAIVTLAPDLTVLTWNPAAEALLGWTAEEVCGQKMPAVQDGKKPDFEMLFQRVLRGEALAGIEVERQCKQHRSITMEVCASPLRDSDGNVGGILALLSDVTERKRSEKALRESEGRLRTLVENAPTGIFIQCRGVFAYVNHAAATLFGAENTEQLLGTPIISRFHPEAREQVAERIRVLKEERRPVPQAEEKCLRLDGSVFEAEFSAVPFSHHGDPAALVFFQEVTARKTLETELRQAQKLEAVGQLAGGIAHDFNNILAAIMLHLDLLQMRDNLEPELREGLQELGNEARRAANLTRQLLMFSRRSVLVAKPVELNAVVANLLRMLNRVIGENIQLRFESDGGLPLVEADPGMLEQVLMNLVVNARDSMPKGGRVSIVTSHHRFEAGDPAYPDRRAGRFVSLAVSDTGSGIDPAILRRIFDPFFTTKEPGVGTGLGLSTVHGIAAQHKGWVEVESKVGQGTSFRVFFPALKDSCIPEDLTPRQEAPLDRGTETILVVEDNGSVLVQLAQSLRLLGYAVHTASNGWQALEVWHRLQGKVDLLITDMVMPEGMTGLELAERLRSFRAGLPVIVSSGYSAEMVHSGIPCHSGVVFLSKPFTTKALVELVRRSLDESKGGHVSKGGFDAENPSKLYTES